MRLRGLEWLLKRSAEHGEEAADICFVPAPVIITCSRCSEFRKGFKEDHDKTTDLIESPGNNAHVPKTQNQNPHL